MPLRRITDAGSEPLTLDEAKLHLRVTGSTEDTLITALIKAARTTCEERLQRSLLTTTWELTLDEFPEAIPLRRPRVQSVTSVKYVDVDGVEQTLDPAAYQVDDKSEPGWVVPAYGYSWPQTRQQVNAVAVRYTTGYGNNASDVPQPLRQWMLLMVGAMYENREAEVIAAGISATPLKFAEHLLDTYYVHEF